MNSIPSLTFVIPSLSASGKFSMASWMIVSTFSSCSLNLAVNCVLFLLWTINITLSVSRAWCGLNSLMRWCMWMNNKLISSIFSSLFGDSGHLIKMSMMSKKFTNTE